MYGAGGSQDGGQYKDTVDLPQTSFGMKANAVQREPEIQKLWEEKQILQKLMDKNTGVRLSFSYSNPRNVYEHHLHSGDFYRGFLLIDLTSQVFNLYNIDL